MAVIPLGLAILTAALGIPGLHGPGRLGGAFAAWWRTVPGHETIAGPLDWLSGLAGWPPFLRTIGQWGLGVAVVGLAFLVLARVGTGFWGSWDRRERQAAHQKTPERPSRIVPAIEFGLLTGIGVEMSVITLMYLWR